MGSFADGKKILLTGGTGSFGQKCTEILLNEFNPDSIRIYSRGELLQYQMEQKFHDKINWHCIKLNNRMFNRFFEWMWVEDVLKGMMHQRYKR